MYLSHLRFYKTKQKFNFFFFNFSHIQGGAFEGVVDDVVSPFGYRKGEGIDAGYGELDWICNRDRERTDSIFVTLNPVDGKISGASKCILYIFLFRF